MTSRPRKWLPIGFVFVAAAFAFVFSLVGPAAQAFPAGQVGHTGSPEVGGATCANCHQGSDLPASLSLDAPTSMRVGETTMVTLTLSGGPGTVGGFNAAALGGAGNLLAAAVGSQLAQGEVTHAAPLPFTAGQAVFSFEWQAPAEPTTVVWYAAGVSGNGDSATSGDAVALAQRSITVEAAPTPTPVSVVILTPTPAAGDGGEAGADSADSSVVDATPTGEGGAFGFGLSPRAGAESTSATAAATNAEGGAGLAATGSEVTVPAALAVALFLTGGATVVAGRRRQR